MRDSKEFKDRFLRWKDGKLVYENGRALPVFEDDETSYKEIMKDVARENYRQWGYNNPADAWQDLLNNPTYNYRGYYTDPKFYGTQSGSFYSHWPDTYKTPLHETFSNESLYHGKKSKTNPSGLRGGLWIGDKFIPAAWLSRIQRYKDGKLPKFEDGEEPQIDLSDVQREVTLRLQYDPVSQDLSKPMSPVDPVGEAVVEYAALGPLFKGAYNTVKAIKPIMEGRKAAIDFLASNAYKSKYTAKYPQDLAEIAAKQIGAIKNSKFIPFPVPFLRKTVGLNFKLPSGNSVQWYNTLSDNLPFLKEAATHESFHAGSKGLWNTGIREHVHFSDASKALDLTDRAVLNVVNMAKKSLKNRLFPKSADKRIALRVEDARNYYRNPDELRSHALTAEVYGPESLNYKSLKDAFGEDAIRKLQNFYHEWALPKLGLTIE